MMEEACVCETTAGGRCRSLVRISSMGSMLFVHSGFPTEAPDAVFFGPDTYRFCRALEWIAGQDRGFSPAGVIDIGAGTGAGGLYAGKIFPSVQKIILSDINDKALALAQVNAALNVARGVEYVHSDVLANIAF